MIHRDEPPPAGPHYWRPILRRCSCGWTQRRTVGYRRAGMNWDAHIGDVVERRLGTRNAISEGYEKAIGHTAAAGKAIRSAMWVLVIGAAVIAAFLIVALTYALSH